MYKTKINKILNIVEKLKTDITLSILGEFLEWFYEKIDIHFNIKTPNIIPNIGDIFEVELGQNIGSELNKKRPCVVVSKSKYNKGNTIIIVPIRSVKQNTRIGNISYEINISNTGLFKRSFLTPINIKEVSKKRLLNKIGKLSKNDQYELKKILAKIFEIKNL